MSSRDDLEGREGCGGEAEVASTPGTREAQFLEAAIGEVSRSTSASSMTDGSPEEETWWASLHQNSDPCTLSTSWSTKRSTDQWSFPLLDFSKAKLALDESWWSLLAADSVRLAEDLAKGGFPVPASWVPANFDPKRIWKKLRRYRHFLLFVTAVTVINGLFSILLLECLLGTSKVCFFSSCQSPQYTPASSFAYDLSNLNKSLAWLPAIDSPQQPGFIPTYTDADDEAFLNEVSEEWDVTPHASVPRAYSLRKKQGHYRALLVQDICYLFMQGTGWDHGRPTGVWFDADTIDTVRAGDIRGVLDARDLQKLDLVQLLVEPEEEDEEGDVHNGAFKFTPDYGKAEKRVSRTVGSFVGARGLSDYIQLSSNTATRHLKLSQDPNPAMVGLVGGFQSNTASFSSNSVFLSEVVSPAASLLRSSVVFFPGDRRVASQWTEGALKASVGPQSSAVAGQAQGQPFCFRNVLFLLNERPAAAVEIDNFRQKAWGIADSAVLSLKTNNNQALTPARVQKVISDAPPDVRLQLGYSADPARTVQLLSRVAESLSRSQITVLVDSAAQGNVSSSKIGNLEDVLVLVRRMFPKMEVAPFSLAESSFVEQAAIFKRTVLLIAPYGLASGSIMLLPRGASIIEIFPFMFRSEATISTARAAGVSYYKWENENVEDSKYEEDCLSRSGFQSLTVTECRRHRPCLFCVRDHVSTSIDRKEFRAVLLKSQQSVKSFLESSRKSGGRSYLR